MGCDCSKNGNPTGYGSNPNTEQQIQQQLLAQQSQVPQNGAQEQAKASGSVMGFALMDRSGRVQTFGSSLERNAYRVREGGTIVP